jgi:hypothetical protein
MAQMYEYDHLLANLELEDITKDDDDISSPVIVKKEVKRKKTKVQKPSNIDLEDIEELFRENPDMFEEPKGKTHAKKEYKGDGIESNLLTMPPTLQRLLQIESILDIAKKSIDVNPKEEGIVLKPRLYGYSCYDAPRRNGSYMIKPLLFQSKLCCTQGEIDYSKFQITTPLQKHQATICQDLEDRVQKKGFDENGAMIFLPMGFGKTLCAFYAVIRLLNEKKKDVRSIFVLVYNTDLKSQMAKEFMTHTNICPCRIFLPKTMRGFKVYVDQST